ncbi:MAG TPA: glycosyltransferase family 2 protein [Chthoniobacterales bacterium]|nr:glycosyltransferase family 2 protein [Chthoniobacterales bacterium]
MSVARKLDHGTSRANSLGRKNRAAVAVVIVNYRTPELAKTCLEAVARERAAFRDLKVLLVDGGSADTSAEQLHQLIGQGDFSEWVEFLPLQVNGGFGWANNQAIQRLIRGSEGPDYIHVLNPDAEVEAGAIGWLSQYLDNHPRTGAIGSKLLKSDGSSSASAFRFPSIGSEFARGARTAFLERMFGIRPISVETEDAAEVDWVSGASVMFRVEALRQAGLFDEGFFLYHEEVELMWRLRKAGWAIATEPRSRVRHVGGAATGVDSDKTRESAARRNPTYLYRSRTRFFGLTRGRIIAALAFTAWLAGDAIWKMRKLLRLAPADERVNHEFMDHLSKAFPRKHDFEPAVSKLGAKPTNVPAWMCKGWL